MIKEKNKRGFTLMEIIVVIAISSIFFTVVALILQSSFNIFNNSKADYNDYNNEHLINTSTDTFINKVNLKGNSVVYKEANEIVVIECDDEKIEISNSLFIYESAGAQLSKIELTSITVKCSIINTNSLKITISDSSGPTSEKIYQIIGGIK